MFDEKKIKILVHDDQDEELFLTSYAYDFCKIVSALNAQAKTKGRENNDIIQKINSI